MGQMLRITARLLVALVAGLPGKTGRLFFGEMPRGSRGAFVRFAPCKHPARSTPRLIAALHLQFAQVDRARKPGRGS